jgi:SHS family lactate transporter-like MFS transporter
VDGKPGLVPDYAKVQGILIGAVVAFIVIITVIGPECVFSPSFLLWIRRWMNANGALRRNHGSHFERHRAAFDEGGGRDDAYIDDEGVHTVAGDAEKASEERSSTEKERLSTEKRVA